uniref:hypothetical protein n=1 Tax=Actinoplanes sp. CA-151224 TaxID=3239904 RepID=UPI003F495BEC
MIGPLERSKIYFLIGVSRQDQSGVDGGAKALTGHAEMQKSAFIDFCISTHTELDIRSTNTINLARWREAPTSRETGAKRPR